MSFSVRFIFLLLTLAAVGVACVRPPPPGLTAARLQLLTTCGREEVFAASPDGFLVAFGRDGLLLLDRASRQTRRLTENSPLVLGWRRDGTRLAAAFVAADGSGRLAIYDRTGTLLDEQPLPGRPLALTWSSRHDLLVIGYRLQIYSFGGNLAQWLVRSDDQESTTLTLGDVTVKPGTARQLAPALPTLLQAAFSPDGDELAYLRLHDPPEFPPYLRLLHRNWQADGERQLADLPVQPTKISWEPAGEGILLVASEQAPRRIDLWPEPVAGRQSLAVPPLFDAIADFGSRVQILDDGRYLLASDGCLYLGEGLPVQERPAHDDQAWMLRKWRFEGLITPEEFKEARP